MLMVGFLSWQVFSIRQRYETTSRWIQDTVNDNPLLRLIFQGDNFFDVISSGRIFPEVVDEEMIQFDWPAAAATLAKAANFMTEVSEIMSMRAPDPEIQDVFLDIQTYSDWTASIAKVATQVDPVGPKNPKARKFNETDDLDSILEEFGQLLPFLKKQLDIPKWVFAAKHCTQLFSNILAVPWRGTYRDYRGGGGGTPMHWRMPHVIERYVFPTILETCRAISSLEKKSSSSPRIKVV